MENKDDDDELFDRLQVSNKTTKTIDGHFVFL